MKKLLCITVLLSACASPPPSPDARPDLAEPSASAEISSRKPGREVPQGRALKSAVPASEVALYALGLLNVRYQFGGNNPDSGLDCSGMTAYVYREAAGIELPRTAAQQARLGRAVDINELEPGDLLFFNTRGSSYSHVGLYIGEGRFVHAPSSNKRIQVTTLDNPYFAKRYQLARRLLD